MENETTNRTGNLLIALLFLSVMLVIMLLAFTLTFSALTQANLDLTQANTTAFAVFNETGFANSSGYTLSTADLTGFASPVLTAVYNLSNATHIPVALGNFSVSGAGVVTNASDVVWDNISLSYTGTYDAYVNGTVNTGIESIQTGIFGLVSNFFALAPTIGTILAVVLLVAGIFLLIVYVQRMKNAGAGDSNVAFSG